MNRDEFDWPAVRAAADARMKELGLSTGEVAYKMHMAKRTLRDFLDGHTMPHRTTVYRLNDALGLPYDHLNAMAEKREPWLKPETQAIAAGKEMPAPTSAPVAALLSLADLGPGAQIVADYRAYVLMVAKEMTEGMTGEQQQNVGRFLNDLSSAVRFPKWW